MFGAETLTKDQLKRVKKALSHVDAILSVQSVMVDDKPMIVVEYVFKGKTMRSLINGFKK